MLEFLFPNTIEIPFAIELIIEFLLFSGVLFAVLTKTGFFNKLKEDLVHDMKEHMDDQYLPRLEDMAKSTHLCSMQDSIKELLENSREQTKQIRLLSSTEATLLRDRLNEVYHKYSEKGTIDSYSLQAATAMYEKYKELGGNGYIDLIYTKLIKLPVTD